MKFIALVTITIILINSSYAIPGESLACLAKCKATAAKKATESFDDMKKYTEDVY